MRHQVLRTGPGAPCDEVGHHRAPAGIHRHRISLKFGGLQNHLHPLPVPVGGVVIDGVEIQQCRTQGGPDRRRWVGLVEHRGEFPQM